MPIYQFHTGDHANLDVEASADLPNVDAARQVAIKYASALLADGGPNLSQSDVTVRVMDVTGAELFSIIVTTAQRRLPAVALTTAPDLPTDPGCPAHAR